MKAQAIMSCKGYKNKGHRRTTLTQSRVFRPGDCLHLQLCWRKVHQILGFCVSPAKKNRETRAFSWDSINHSLHFPTSSSQHMNESNSPIEAMGDSVDCYNVLKKKHGMTVPRSSNIYAVKQIRKTWDLFRSCSGLKFLLVQDFFHQQCLCLESRTISV